MAGKRTRRASQAFQPTKISEDEFTSGDKFVFTLDSPSPKGRVTRSRRSSVCLNPPTKPVTKARRQTMLPAVKEMPKSPNKKSNVVEQLLNTPSKNTGEFYASPAKPKASKKTTVSEVSPTKSVSVASLSVSPTKKFSKSANKTLTESEILENLDQDESDAEFDKKTLDNAAKESSKKNIPVKENADKKSKIPVKSPPAKPAKTKPVKEKAKEPSVKGGKIKKSPIKKSSKLIGIAKPDLKTPQKVVKVSLKDLPPGSPLLDSIFKDIKKVEIRLTPMKIKEDPNVIFDLLEEHQQSKFRVQKVVDEILKMKKEASPKTRLNSSNDESTSVSVPVNEAEKSIEKPASKLKGNPKSSKKNETKKADLKKTGASPTLNKRAKTAAVKKSQGTAKNIEVDNKQKKKNAKDVKAENVKPKPVNTKIQEKKVLMSAKTGVKRALETKATPVQNKRIKLEKETPKTPKPVEISVKKQTKTPATAKKQLKTPKPEIKSEPITPVTPEVTQVMAKSVAKASAQKSGSKKTPKLMAQYKQKTPIGSLKKPLKRLSVAKSTPAQVKPSDLLKKNLRKQVETAITAKIGSKPDSSPYTISVAGGNDASPVFTKVETVNSKVVKKHITGTPARTKPARKFGTVIQPASLLEDSVMPTSTIEHKAVSSSTPLRAALTGFEENSFEPHPLESVEATPIRAPTSPEPRSPEPMMVTGGLAKMCSIM